MTVRGDRTKSALIAATISLVGELGYHQTTTKAIAALAGVSEATIYRHFPDKRALFFAAVLDGHQPVLAWMNTLPDRAGTGELADTLTECLRQLATLREAVLPLELALANDPDLTRHLHDATLSPTLEAQGGPPYLLAQYLAAEQRLGRIRPGIDTDQAAIILLLTLFGIGANPLTRHTAIADDLIQGAVALILNGITT